VNVGRNVTEPRVAGTSRKVFFSGIIRSTPNFHWFASLRDTVTVSVNWNWLGDLVISAGVRRSEAIAAGAEI